MMLYRAVVLTDKGLLRDDNEDDYYFAGKSLSEATSSEHFEAELPRGSERSIFAICDGMGGESRGEEASAIGVSGLAAVEKRLREDPELNLEDLLPAYLQTVNEVICERMRENKGLRMGTTFSALLLDETFACTINLGDSRIYLYRDHRLYRLTKDQTHAERMVDIGLLTREEADRHPERHRLLQHLGLFPEERRLDPFFSPSFCLFKGDRLLLCSDGISEMVDQQTIIDVLAGEQDTRAAGRTLLAAALEGGGKDNATLILLDIMDVEPEPKRPLIRQLTGIIQTPPPLPISPANTGQTKELSGLPKRLNAGSLPGGQQTLGDIGSTEEEREKKDMKKREGSSSVHRDSGQEPLSRPQHSLESPVEPAAVRAAGPLTKADWERFELAKKAAEERRAQQKRAEQGRVGAPAEPAAGLTGPAQADRPLRKAPPLSQAPGRGSKPAAGSRRTAAQKDDVLNRKPRHHVADGHLVAPPKSVKRPRGAAGRSRRPQGAGDRGQPGQEAYSRPAGRSPGSGRPPQAAYGGTAAMGHYAEPAAAHRGARAEAAGSDRYPRQRKKSGLRFFISLLLALAVGFAFGWLLLNIGHLL